MVAHNPNLVVGSDAEQVVVANATKREIPGGLPHVTYQAGALEGLLEWEKSQSPVSDEVCRILEGGREAFAKREQKYRIPALKPSAQLD